jgi:hypothetical protein
MTDDLTSSKSLSPRRSPEAHLNPALKSWLHNVIVPALVKKWIATNEGNHDSGNDESSSAEKQTVKI